MYEEIFEQINLVLKALNSVSVCGKTNLANMSGSIAILENVAGYIEQTMKENLEAPKEQ